jgi:hypothetical protein
MNRWLLLALLFTAQSVRALPVEDYVFRLETIDALLAQKALEPAKIEARELLDTSVTWRRGAFLADASVLQPILDAQAPEGPHRARLLATIAELRRATGMETAGGDRRLLERIAAEQDVPDLPRGGTIPTKLERDVPMLERIATAIADMFEWVWDKLVEFLRWLADLFPRRRPNESTASAGLRWMVYAVVAAIVIVVLTLAAGVLRRSRASVATTVETSAPLGSKADEDPLSRGAMEWERYARELARSERYREAIRAWYHAVLVTCYAAGILHFRKGRTNWEYLASLPPSLEWRADMIELTRRFEREWYGSLHSTEDALENCGELAERILDALRIEMRGVA